MRNVQTFFMLTVLASSALVVSGCKPSMIPGTGIEDTDTNRAVIDFMEVYRHAIESRESEKILELVAEEYFEDNGSSDQTDDYGLEHLQSGLAKQFEHTKALQLNLTIQHIEPAPESEHIHVFYRYLQRALLQLPAGQTWVSSSDVNRLVLKAKGDRVEDGFLIVSGL